MAVRRLERYIHGNEKRLICTARGDKLESLEAAGVLKKAKIEKRLGVESFIWLVFETN